MPDSPMLDKPITADAHERFSGTRPLAAHNAIDLTRLAAFMREHVAGFGGVLSAEQFKGGQSNPTFRLSAGGRHYVLRRKPPGMLLPSAHAVEREFRVISALAESEVPVARAYALCEDPGVIGSAFYIMDCVEGRVLWDPLLPGMAPPQRGAIHDELNRVIAALHRIDPAAVGLGDYGRPGKYLERQVARWTQQYRAAQTETIAAMERLIDWLPQHIPVADDAAAGSRIVHGDYRLDNVIFHATEPRILAVLDWELSTLGHPMVDFAYHCMTWRMPSGATRGMHGADLAALGIPLEADYVQTYLRRVGGACGDVSAADWNYYLAFNMFRLAGILQGITARARQGNAASAEAEAAGQRTRPLAEQAWALARSLG